MTYDELMNAVLTSDRDDWVPSGENDLVFKGDLNVRIVDSTVDIHGEEAVSFNTFSEKWADVVPEGHEGPYKKAFSLYYGVSLVEVVNMVGVDDGRGYLPLPKSHKDLTISRWQYQFVKLVEPRPGDETYGLDAWLNKAGITIQR